MTGAHAAFRRLTLGLFLLAGLCLSSAAVQASVQATGDFAAAVQALDAKRFADKARAIEALAATGHERSAVILRAMLDGRLYYRKRDRRVVIAERLEKGFRISDAVTGEPLGEVGKRKVKKISINNKLRKQLRATLARLSLSHRDPRVRRQSVQEMLATVSAAAVPTLERALARETDEEVAELLRTALALAALDSPDREERLRALRVLEGNIQPEVGNRIRRLLERDSDAAVQAAAQRALTAIESKLKFYEFLETLFFGLSMGSVLLLAAIGLAITFGVMGVINMAHGELIMLGAYTTYLVQLLMPNHLELSLLVAIPAAFLVSGLFGIAIERGVIRFLYGRPLETLLATFGISLLLQQLVRTTISAQNVTVANPQWLSGSLEINAALSLTYNRLYILCFALLVFAALLLILKKTSLGLQVRAVSQNRAMARALGIRSGWVDAMTFGLGSGIAGVAGVALSQLTNVGPNMGQAYIIDSFMVVVFGGVGNLWGTLVGAFTLGVVNKFLEPWAGAVLAKILVLVFIILFIQKRPRGLFPQKGRSAES